MEGLSAIINPVSLLMHLVNIVILYIVFRLLLYKPVAKFMKSRQERFAKEREELDAEKAEADAIRAQGDEILHKARSDAETQVAQIMAAADKDAKSIREEAQKQAGVIIENAKQEAQEEKRRQLEAMHDPGDGALRRPGQPHPRARNQARRPSEADGGIPFRGEVIC